MGKLSEAQDKSKMLETIDPLWVRGGLAVLDARREGRS